MNKAAALPEPRAVAMAILADVASRMPTLAEVAASPAEDAMGPDVTLPAIHMHILTQHLRHLDAQLSGAAIDFKIAQRTSIGLAPDDVGDARAEYAGQLAELLVKAFAGKHDGAVSTLLQSAAAILATKYDGQFAARALEAGTAIFAAGIRDNFAPKGSLQ